jgi:hypothetical protein
MSRTLLLLLYHVPAVYDVCLRPSDVCNLGRTRGNRVARGGTLLRAGHEAIAARVSFFKSILTCMCMRLESVLGRVGGRRRAIRKGTWCRHFTASGCSQASVNEAT